MSAKIERTKAQIRAEKVKSMNMHEAVHNRLKQFAADNNMSTSEAVREAMTYYINHNVLPTRIRRTKRVSFWIPPELYAAFVKQTQADGTTISGGLEAALEAIQ